MIGLRIFLPFQSHGSDARRRRATPTAVGQGDRGSDMYEDHRDPDAEMLASFVRDTRRVDPSVRATAAEAGHGKDWLRAGVKLRSGSRDEARGYQSDDPNRQAVIAFVECNDGLKGQAAHTSQRSSRPPSAPNQAVISAISRFCIVTIGRVTSLLKP